jgi:NAD(P)-dependent dehydrogenase (short-subunit alcohol dehydrogenase family)
LERSFADQGVADARDLQLFAADLSDAAATAAVARDVVARLGTIDAVAHTAGGFRGGQRVVDTPVEALDLMLRLNLYTAFAVARATLPVMLERGRGSLTLVAARAGLAGRAELAAYGAAKSGVLRLMESLAEETTGTGVRVNCLLPDAIAPPGGGPGTPPAAIAEVLVYLASDAARAITGAAIPV